MSTTSGGKDVATKDTNHKAVAAPQTSLYPPPPPGAPVPTPILTTSDTSKASSTESATTIAGAAVVVKGSVMDTDSPGNAPSQVLGGDVVSHGIAGVAGKIEVKSGSSSTLVDGKGVATTGDSAAMNKPSPVGGVAQQSGALVKGAGTGMSSASEDDEGGEGSAGKKSASAPSQAVDGGRSSNGRYRLRDRRRGRARAARLDPAGVEAALLVAALQGAWPVRQGRLDAQPRAVDRGGRSDMALPRRGRALHLLRQDRRHGRAPSTGASG